MRLSSLLGATRLTAATAGCCFRRCEALLKRFGREWNSTCHAPRLTKHRTRSMIFGTLLMELHRLVEAILAGDLLTARQWVADARRERWTWHDVVQPRELSGRELTVAAGLVEL